ncbi:MAG: hypothetical protein Q8K42_09110, partial [Methylobacter sp.]|nr:hypothetical protein [Methylobacter sp.]
SIDSSSEILEEILDLTRNNQKLLRNPDGEFIKEVESIKVMLEKFGKRLVDSDGETRRPRRDRKMHPMMREMYMPDKEMWMIGREVHRTLKRSLERYL